MRKIQGELDARLADKRTLFNNAYKTKNPDVTGTNTTWKGHTQEIEDLQRGLKRMIREANEMKCSIPSGAFEMAWRRIPTAPGPKD